jgi:hypothetical protein
MQGPKDEHHQNIMWNVYFAPRHIIEHPVKAQTKGHNLFGLVHIVIEQQHQPCECISNQVWLMVQFKAASISKPFPSN